MRQIKTRPIILARDLLLQGALSEALVIIEPSASSDTSAALMLAQIRAFQGEWQEVRSLCTLLLKQPFALCQYRDAQDVMKLFSLATTDGADWPEALAIVEAIREELEQSIDMAAEHNSFAESFNRFEAYIRAQGKGRQPFKINSPLTFASMGEEQYAKLMGLATQGKAVTSFSQLDAASQHDFYLWKALYNEDLEKALALYEEEGGGFVRSLTQATLIAQLLLTFGQENRAWEILSAQIKKWTPQHTWEIAPLDLLWDEKMRPLMTPENCHQLLLMPRAINWNKKGPEDIWERERLTHICSLGRCLTEDAVQKIEQRLTEDADNLELRLMLIGAYSKYIAKNIDLKKPHISWLIAKFPQGEIIEDLLPYLFLDKTTNAEDFEDFKQQWLEVIESRPDDTSVLFNASLLLGADDKALAEELLTRAQMIDPDNIKIAERLYELNAYQVNQTADAQRLTHAREALNQIALMEDLETKHNSSNEAFNKLRNLRRRAWFSLESGELDLSAKLCSEMLELAKQEDSEDKYLCLSNVITGRLALRVGAGAQAVQNLKALLALEPLRHFRPDHPYMTLARELVEAGEKDAVLAFLQNLHDQFGQSWPPEDAPLLERFQAEILEETTPWVPAVRL